AQLRRARRRSGRPQDREEHSAPSCRSARRAGTAHRLHGLRRGRLHDWIGRRSRRRADRALMTNMLVMMELNRAGRCKPSSLETLGQARLLATQLGATLHVLAITSSDAQQDALATELSHHGADRVVLGMHARAGELRWDTHGALLTQLCER